MPKILPTPSASAQFRALAEKAGGVNSLATALGVSRDPVYAVMNGTPVLDSTWMLMRARLPEAERRIRRRAEAAKDPAKANDKRKLRSMLTAALQRIEQLEQDRIVERARRTLAAHNANQGVRQEAAKINAEKQTRAEVDKAMAIPAAYTRDEKPTASGFERDPVTGEQKFRGNTPTQARRLAAGRPHVQQPTSGFQRDAQTGTYVMQETSPKEARRNARGGK